MVSLELEEKRRRGRRLDEGPIQGVKSERIPGSKWPHSMMAFIVREEERRKDEKYDYDDGMNGL